MCLQAVFLTLLVISPVLASGQKKRPEDQEAMRPNPAAASSDAPLQASCPAGGLLGEMELKVKTASHPDPLPFVNIIHLSEGDTLLYAPVVRGREKREGEVALVLVPTKISGKEMLIVTDVRDASKPQEWQIPRTIALAVFVYGPQGLNKKKVKNFLSQDSALVAQMADYADKTAQTEALLTALSNAESSPASVNAALTGFASQYGVAVQIDKTAPANVQAQTLFAAMNPQLATYSPLAASGASRASQTASLATAAAGLLFGSPVGLLAGGTSMLLDLRSLAFPDTQFRSSFSQVTNGARLNLCGERSAAPPRTRIAYIWASRIPQEPAPKLQLGDAHFAAETQKSVVPAQIADPIWKYLQRAHQWALENDAKVHVELPVLKLQNQKAIELDLSKAKLSPGVYHLTAYWDWDKFQASGDVNVLPLSAFAGAHLTSGSQDNLLANGGKIPVTVSGSDFEFVTKVEVKKVGDEFAVPEPAKFLLPKGPHLGPQNDIDVQVDTHGLEAGHYQLLFSQSDGKPHPVPFSILPNPPEISNFPILANEGVNTQHYVLKGERLDQINKLDASGVAFELGATSAGNTERNVSLKMTAELKPGSSIAVRAFLNERTQPISFENALQITGPLPQVVSSKLSLPSTMAIKTSGNEFPAGTTLSAMLDVKNIDRTSTLQIGCEGGVGQTTDLQIGQQTTHWDLQQLSPDQLFVSFDTNALPAGCVLQAKIRNGNQGVSSPYNLAHIIRVPQIESFLQTSEPAPAGQASYTIKGRSLEMIEKVGWDATNGMIPTGLPVPVPGEGQKQTLQVVLPAPPGQDAATFLWLRGDKTGRETTIKATASVESASPASVPGTPVKPGNGSK